MNADHKFGLMKFTTCHLLLLLSLLPLLCSAAKPAASTADGETPLEKSVEPFYKLTEGFLDFIQPAERAVMAEAFLDIFNFGNGSTVSSDFVSRWKEKTREYSLSMLGYLILIVFGLLFIFLVPLIGFIVCCCRCCCGKCGGRLHHMERKNAKCRRTTYGMMLTLLTTLMLCGVVLALISNHLAHNSLSPHSSDSVLKEMSNGLHDAAAQLEAVDSANRQNRTKAAILRAVSGIGPAALRALSELVAQLTKLSGINDLTSSAETAVASLNRTVGAMGYALGSKSRLEEMMKGLNDTLKEARTNLTYVADDICPSSSSSSGKSVKCDELRQVLNNLRAQVSPEALDIDRLTNAHKDAKEHLEPASEALVRIKKAVANLTGLANSTVEDGLAKLRDSLNNTRAMGSIIDKTANVAREIASKLQELGDKLNDSAINPLSNKEQRLPAIVSSFDSYRYYLCIGLGIVALVIIVFYYLGLAFGFCGEPPYEDARCCNRGAGANFLLAGTGFAFLLAWLLMLFVMIFFMTGAVTDTEICRYVAGRHGSSGYKTLDDAIRPLLRSLMSDNATKSVRPFSGLLGDCNSPEGGISGAVDLEYLLWVSKLDEKIDSKIKELLDHMVERRSDFADNFTVDGNLARLSSAVRSLNSTDIDSIIAALKRSPVKAKDKEVLGYFSSESKQVEAWLSAISSQADALQREMKKLEERLQPLKSVELPALREAANDIPKKVANAKEAIKNVTIFRVAADAATRNLSGELSSLLRTALADAVQEVIDCPALSAATRRFVRAPCTQFLRPFNGYWAGLGFFLICLLPCLIITIKLANLYRKTNKYEKDYDEPDYMAYQGFYPSDTIPLDGQRKPKRNKRSKDNPCNGCTVAPTTPGAQCQCSRL